MVAPELMFALALLLLSVLEAPMMMMMDAHRLIIEPLGLYLAAVHNALPAIATECVIQFSIVSTNRFKYEFHVNLKIFF